ncbi:hypothetical protein NC99_41290 [Sunxiuqinia dokdonensis]|uniref:Uncharacterized protein n=1 Tax=Sunxiuqinia dokdonensis TaxID=1409788 RepID=A0A0L8V477_9BACT|nr:hypothetical protein NC99_41290 [Sunxiuqinia dokdonensis]
MGQMYIIVNKGQTRPISNFGLSNLKIVKIQSAFNSFLLKTCIAQTIRIEQFSYICA